MNQEETKKVQEKFQEIVVLHQQLKIAILEGEDEDIHRDKMIKTHDEIDCRYAALTDYLESTIKHTSSS